MARDALVTIEQVAEHLGVPVRTLYAWRYRREGPPALRVGRYLRYRWVDIDAWLDEQRKTRT
jgi:excisionase family DNA binding protein